MCKLVVIGSLYIISYTLITNILHIYSYTHSKFSKVSYLPNHRNSTIQEYITQCDTANSYSPIISKPRIYLNSQKKANIYNLFIMAIRAHQCSKQASTDPNFSAQKAYSNKTQNTVIQQTQKR